MRIGLLAPPWTPIPPPLYGGIELVVDQLARGFTEAGHDVTLFTTGDSTCPVKKLFILPEADGFRIGTAVPEMRHAIHGYKALADQDIIHDHTVFGPFYSDRFPDMPVATTIHGPLNDELSDLYSDLSPRIAIIAISHAQLAPLPSLKVARVIHHGLDARQFPFGEGAGDRDGRYVLFLGRMASAKGAHRAIAIARKAGMRILLAAKMREDPEKQYFHEKVEPLLGNDAIYLGEVEHEKKLELLANATALLFPIRWNEPFGMIMLEAMACGTPVLAFPEGSTPEVVDHGVTGFLCQDEDEMVAALQKVNTIDRKQCRAAVEGYFSTRRMVEEHLELYTSIIGK